MDDQRLAARALAQLMDFVDERGGKLLLVVENLNMLLEEQLGSDDDWTLRHTLMNEPRAMLLGTATASFDEISNIDKAWFELFEQIELKPLSTADCQPLWNKITGQEISEQQLHPVRILTGGNPRLVRILAEFAAQLSFQDLMTNLTRLIDEHTDYFKGQLESLPAQERKIFVALLEIWDPATAKEVSQKARLDINKASSVLNRLVNRGAVEVVEKEGRRKYYQATERLYNIYYLMRRRSTAASRVRAAVDFMVQYYQEQDLVLATTKLAKEIGGINQDFRQDLYCAYGEIVNHKGITKSLKTEILKATPEDFFTAFDLPEELKQLSNALTDTSESAVSLSPIESEKELRKRIEINPHDHKAWTQLGQLLHEHLERYDEAEEAYRKAIELKSDYEWAWAKLGQLLHERLERYDEAEQAYRKATELKPDDAWDWAKLGQLLHERLERYNEAEQAYRKAIELKPDDAWDWAKLGQLLHERLERYDEAEQAYRKAIELEPDDAWDWAQLGQLLHERLERYDEAEQTYRKAIELKPDDAWALGQLGQLLHECLERYDEAEQTYRKTIELEPDYEWAWGQLGLLYEHLERFDEAEAAYCKGISIKSSQAWNFWAHFGKLLHVRLERYDEAEEAYRKAIELVPPNYEWILWLFRGKLLHECLKNYGEAKEAYRKAIELKPDNAELWVRLGQLLHEHLELYDEAFTAFAKLLTLKNASNFIGPITSFFVEAVVRGNTLETVRVLTNCPIASKLEPLIIGIKLFQGENPRQAQEITEVAQDIAKRIHDRQKALSENIQENQKSD
ncbi:MAG: tetratricopeptide repeat protein [Synechococcus sp.]